MLRPEGRLTTGRADGNGRDPIECCLDDRNDKDFGIDRTGDVGVDRTDGEEKQDKDWDSSTLGFPGSQDISRHAASQCCPYIPERYLDRLVDPSDTWPDNCF